MVRYMYDSVNASAILAVDPHPQMVAGYSDTIKIPQWTSEDWQLFPNAVKVSIVKKASSSWGDVLDVEVGDATPAEAPDWVLMRRKAGADPSVYCNQSTWPAVRTAFQNRGILEPWYWIAKYDGDPTIPASWINARCVAKQYHGNDPKNYDKSVVLDYWPGIDKREENDMQLNEVVGHRPDGTTFTVADALAGSYLPFFYPPNPSRSKLDDILAKLDILAGVVEKLSTDPDITANNIKTWIADAVTQHMSITGNITVTGQ